MKIKSSFLKTGQKHSISMTPSMSSPPTRGVALLGWSFSGPKTVLMESLGAEVVLLAPGPRWDSPDGPLGVAAKIAQQRDGLFLDQFSTENLFGE